MENIKPNENNYNYFWAAIIVLTCLSGGLGYLYLKEKKLNDQKQSKIEGQIKEQLVTSGKIDSLYRELDFKITEIAKLGGDISSLIAIKANLLADKKMLASQKNINIKPFEEKIRNYQNILAQKDIDIQKLKEENGLLTSKNESLGSENSGLKTDKKQLVDSIIAVSVINKELAAKVTLASALKAETINVYAISSRGKEREGGSYNGRKVDKIRISFHLVDNPLSKQEEKEILIRILDPTGTIISDRATGSDIFTYNGQEMLYTTKKREFYTNTHQLVEVVYARGNEYKQGKYTIELYCERYKIGIGSFEVK